MLECCAAINSEASAFKNAFDIFNNGGSAAAVRTALSTKAPSFAKSLKARDETLFQVPTAPKKDPVHLKNTSDEFGVLG
jgi:hypothetical protein